MADRSFVGDTYPVSSSVWAVSVHAVDLAEYACTVVVCVLGKGRARLVNRAEPQKWLLVVTKVVQQPNQMIVFSSCVTILAVSKHKPLSRLEATKTESRHVSGNGWRFVAQPRPSTRFGETKEDYQTKKKTTEDQIAASPGSSEISLPLSLPLTAVQTTAASSP